MQPFTENPVNTPLFLGKLWKMVNDPQTDHLICWSMAGNSFIIQNQAQFWYELLPVYYKHNNMSSFVRQLNMYGFHKMSTVENGTMDSDKDEIQFTHPYFQRDHPELLKNIKRKTTSKPTTVANENLATHDELAKVLTDVKQLRGRQATVDNQLNAMKQENALLWREVAILRQKHIKQQKIVNKLIQFLVTLVNPSRMTVGVKRGYQLMLNESPVKKAKVSSSKSSGHPEGPTIHELDNELDLPSNIYEDEPMIQSPPKSTSQQSDAVNSPLESILLPDDKEEKAPKENSWDKPEYVDIDVLPVEPSDFITEPTLNEESLIESLEEPPATVEAVFLNPSAQNAFLSSLMKPDATSGSGNLSGNLKKENEESNPPPINTNMTVATRDVNLGDLVKSMPGTSDVYSEDLNSHVESTQSELDQLKDILNGYNSFVDANALLGEIINKMPQSFGSLEVLFNDPDSHVYDLPDLNNDNNATETGDPLVSGSELAPYTGNFDFAELLDESLDGEVETAPTSVVSTLTSIETPKVTREEPKFPTVVRK